MFFVLKFERILKRRSMYLLFLHLLFLFCLRKRTRHETADNLPLCLLAEEH